MSDKLAHLENTQRAMMEAIASLSPEVRQQTEDALEELREIVLRSPLAGINAISLLYAELMIQLERNNLKNG